MRHLSEWIGRASSDDCRSWRGLNQHTARAGLKVARQACSGEYSFHPQTTRRRRLALTAALQARLQGGVMVVAGMPVVNGHGAACSPAPPARSACKHSEHDPEESQNRPEPMPQRNLHECLRAVSAPYTAEDQLGAHGGVRALG